MATHNHDQIDDGHYHHWIENNCKAIESKYAQKLNTETVENGK